LTLNRRQMQRKITLLVIASCLLNPRTSIALDEPDSANLRPPAVNRVVLDVELDEKLALSGTVTDENGYAQRDVLVSAERPGERAVQTSTDEYGQFLIPRLRGGVYQLTVLGTQLTCRAWTTGTGPPVARQQLLLVMSDRVTRGQREFGSLLHSDKLLIALIAAGAIAIPAAIISQSDNRSGPSS